jgi:hypothetical protein
MGTSGAAWWPNCKPFLASETRVSSGKSKFLLFFINKLCAGKCYFALLYTLRYNKCIYKKTCRIIKTIFKLYSKYYYRWILSFERRSNLSKIGKYPYFALATVEKGMKLTKEHTCRVQEKKKTYFGTIIDGFVVRQTFVTATPYNVKIMHLCRQPVPMCNM